MIKREKYIVNLADDEAKALRGVAKEEGMNFSTFCRKKLLEEI